MAHFHVKHLPGGAIPDGGVAAWPVSGAEQWRRARLPVIFAPGAGSWALAAVVLTAYVMTVAASSTAAAWPGTGGSGTDWLRYPAAFLLLALPLWYRFLPVAAAVASVGVAADAASALSSTPSLGGTGTAGYLLELGACAWALAGSCLRLRARRRQRRLALDAAGRRRVDLPDGVPETDGRRGHFQVYLGLALCLIAAGVLTDGLVSDLHASGAASPYDAVGHQSVALLLAVPGSTLFGRGMTASRAARRLHDEPQPALIVGVRKGPGGRHWLYPDARTTSGRPLISYVPGDRETRDGVRLLGSGTAYGAGSGHHDIDAAHEPFEAIVYGPLHEGAEVVVECALVEYHAHQGEAGQIRTRLVSAVLRPQQRHGLGPWTPADAAERERARRQQAQAEAERYKEEQRKARLRQEQLRKERQARGRAARPRPSERNRWGSNSGGGCGGGVWDGGSGGGSGDSGHGSGGHSCGGHGCGSSCGGGCGGD
ncbi:hypothetical protein ACQB60_19035 [Actinomycetota bacterium Odt1-20B]